MNKEHGNVLLPIQQEKVRLLSSERRIEELLSQVRLLKKQLAAKK